MWLCSGKRERERERERERDKHTKGPGSILSCECLSF